MIELISNIRGTTNPLLVKSNEKLYVLKSMNKDSYNYSLINEWIAFNIGKLLNVPIPNAQVVSLQFKEKSNYGLLFEYRPPFDYLNLCETNKLPTWQFLSKLKNVNTFSNLLAFDIWINNKDRSSNYGNLLVNKQNNECFYYAIDHGLSFGGYFLNDENKIFLKKSKICELNFASKKHPYPYNHVYEAIKFNIHFRDYNPFADVIERMFRLKSSDIIEFFKQIPQDANWFKDEDVEIYTEYLMSRRENVVSYIEHLIKKMWFPNANSNFSLKLF